MTGRGGAEEGEGVQESVCCELGCGGAGGRVGHGGRSWGAGLMGGEGLEVKWEGGEAVNYWSQFSPSSSLVGR